MVLLHILHLFSQIFTLSLTIPEIRFFFEKTRPKHIIQVFLLIPNFRTLRFISYRFRDKNFFRKNINFCKFRKICKNYKIVKVWRSNIL